jgi:presenilin-like A22 family membrane protease
MKHPISTTALLVLLFFAAQLIGLALLAINITDVTMTNGVRTVTHGETALGERPQTTGGESLLFLVIGVAIGTALVLLLIKFKVFGLWKLWFLVAVWFSTTIALGVLIPSTIALFIALGLAVWKVYRPNPIVHNLTEVFMYAGIAILLVPIFTIWWVVLLLVIISIYDAYAVWHSKHMVVMAKAQTESQVFAGLLVPKSRDAEPMAAPTAPKRNTATVARTAATAGKRISNAPTTNKTATANSKTTSSGSAILGGGDIAFPLIFSGVVMDWLIVGGATKTAALCQTLIVTAAVTVSLALLFIYAKKDRFYPAMPILSAGCLIGFAIVWLLF